MKTHDLVKRALRLIQVINPTQQVSAADMQTGIEVLNGMVTRLEADGISLGWQNVTAPDDELPLPEEALTPISFLLAIEISPEYGVEPMTVVAVKASDAMNTLLRDQMVATPIMPILDVPEPDWRGATRWRSTAWDF